MIFTNTDQKKDLGWIILKIIVITIYVFILTPILITAIVSFNGPGIVEFSPRHFSSHWWREAFTERWLQPLFFSMKLGTLTALISTIIGLPLAYSLNRHEFLGKNVIKVMTVGPLILPTMVTGIALLQFLHIAHLDSLVGYVALLIGHVVICLPFTIRMIDISLIGMPQNVENAAASLGASPLATFWHITLPLASSGIFAGIAFAFIHSFTDVNLSLFIAKPGERPVTVEILSFLEFGFSPTLAAVSMITLLSPLALVFILQRFVKIGDFLYGQRVGNG
jgi:putative spermidine/putrescine transport system permease protein